MAPDPSVKWLRGWFADQIERQLDGAERGTIGVFLTAAEWDSAVVMLRGLPQSARRPKDQRADR